MFKKFECINYKSENKRAQSYSSGDNWFVICKAFLNLNLNLLLKIHCTKTYPMFPNIKTSLRIYISTPATYCTAVKSFPSLKGIKTCLRSKLG